MVGATAAAAATAILTALHRPKMTRTTAPAAAASASSLTVASKLLLFGCLSGNIAAGAPTTKTAASVMSTEAERSAELTQLAWETLARFAFAGLLLAGFANAVLVPLLASGNDVAREAAVRRRHCHRA